MTKISRKHLDSDAFSEYVNNLWSAFTLLSSKDDIRLLFKDLLTYTEYVMLTKRLQIARLLLAGATYEYIIKKLKVTARTITSVQSVLNTKGDGFRKAHKKLYDLEDEHRRKESNRLKDISNPFRIRVQRKTLLGQALKVGIGQLDKTITKRIRHRSAKKYLPT